MLLSASGTYVRHGSPRRLGHGGGGVGTLIPGTTGSVSLDGIEGEYATWTVAVPAAGWVSANAQIGCASPGAEIVTLILVC